MPSLQQGTTFYLYISIDHVTTRMIQKGIAAAHQIVCVFLASISYMRIDKIDCVFFKMGLKNTDLQKLKKGNT